MAQNKKQYVAIDLKSFYASVECVERNLDPLGVNLVVADESRTEKTICLAVSPSLKVYGISGRSRLFEVNQRVREVNAIRRMNAPKHQFKGKSYYADELNKSDNLELSFIVAPPRMSLYVKYSTKIYEIYLKYVAPEDIHVYSIDEVFIDVTGYLKTYKCTARELAMRMIKNVLEETGITATAGIGTNLYLCKIAMDIVAKHTEADENGVRIAELDEMSYQKNLWSHRPITDFWRVGRGISKKLEQYGMFTMGDVAQCSVENENLLYRLFGVNAELLIDHAWGWESCTIEDVKAYRPTTNSISSGQVLKYPYDFEKAKLVMREMTELLVLDLVKKGLVTNQIVLNVGYDIECLRNPDIRRVYSGEIKTDFYGRSVPKHAHGTVNLTRHMSSTKIIVEAVMSLYDRIVNSDLLIRRMNVSANNVISESKAEQQTNFIQFDLFSDPTEQINEEKKRDEELKKERNLQKAILRLEEKYGKNVVLKGMNFLEGATTIERNGQIGGHKA